MRRRMIFSKKRDPRLVTVRRGSLSNVTCSNRAPAGLPLSTARKISPRGFVVLYLRRNASPTVCSGKAPYPSAKGRHYAGRCKRTSENTYLLGTSVNKHSR